MQDIDKDRHDLIADLIRQAGPRTQPSAAMESRVRAAVHAEWQQLLRRERLRRSAGWLAAAMIGAIAITVGWTFLTPAAPPVTVATVAYNPGSLLINTKDLADNAAAATVRSRDTVSTSSAGGARLEFGAGATLRLAPNTRVQWRSVAELELLAGAIYVDSGALHNPLTIATRYGVVSHMGTRYRVKLAPEALSIGVREGRVDVAGPKEKVSAASGEEFKLDSDGRVLRSSLATFGEEWSWVDSLAPRFDIENRSVQEFLSWASNESGHILEYADAETARAANRTILHGSSKSFTPSQAIGAILPTTDFEARYEGRRLIVSRHH